MTSSADAVIAALRSGHDTLAAHVRDLPAADLTGPSGASEWDVSQVLSHLGSGAEIHLATVEAALAGEPTPASSSTRASGRAGTRWPPPTGPRASSPPTTPCWRSTSRSTRTRSRTCGSTWASCQRRSTWPPRRACG
ncbi:maleylpyruvate isomerase N-terminal domain-containing protein [Catellatospora coxensis]